MDDLTILVVPLGYPEWKTSSFYEIIVQFDPICQCCQFRPREPGQRAEIQSVECTSKEIKKEDTG